MTADRKIHVGQEASFVTRMVYTVNILILQKVQVRHRQGTDKTQNNKYSLR